MNKPKKEVEVLIEKLPEQYQQIFSFSKYDSSCSRKCESRLKKILEIYNQIKKQLGRNLRVLDLGCAQGYFSLNLANEGAFVCGVDFNKENINLCNKLSNIHDLTNIEFKIDNIQSFIENNSLKQYDLVLGLSVFHHICHEEGYQFTQNLIKQIANFIPSGIYELALSTEPLYWAASLNENEKDILGCYSYVNQIAISETHLSDIQRPVYYVSNKLFIIKSFAAIFDGALTYPHDFEDNAHNETRKYFISKEIIIKHICFKNIENRFRNRIEFENEIKYLKNDDVLINKPKLIYNFSNNEYGVIAREIISGELLYKVINTINFEAKKQIIMDLISQLVILEAKGLYHNDLRVWNIILDQSNKVSLIDFGAISESKNDCTWPSNVFYSLILLIIEIISEDFKHNKPTRKLDLKKINQLNEWRQPVVKILQEKPENISFKLIQEMLLDSIEQKDATDFNTISYEQNFSLNLHIEKLKDIKKILTHLIYGEESKNLQIDSLLKRIQKLFSEKNNHITWLENVIDEISIHNNELEEKCIDINNNLKLLSDQHEKCIMENESNLNKYNEILLERDIIVKNISSKNDEINDLNKYNAGLSKEVTKLNECNARLSIEINNWNKTNAALSEEVNNLNKSNAALSEEVNNLNKSNDRLSSEIKDSNKSNAALSEEVNHLNNSNAALSNKIYNVSFTKHVYRAYKRLFRQGKYK